MRYEIRALSFAEILDTAFRLVRNHGKLLIGLPALVHVPVVVLQRWLLAPGQAAGAAPVRTTIAGVVMLVLILVVFPFIFMSLTWAIGRVYTGDQPTFGDTLRESRRYLVPVIGTSLLYVLFVLGMAALVGLAMLVAAFLVPNQWVLAVALIGVVGFVALCWLFLAYLLVWPVMMLEKIFGMRALARSRELMQGRKWRAVGLTFVAGLIVAVLGGVLQLALSFIPLVGTLAEGLAQAVGIAYQTTVTTLLYFDARSRAEAFDVEHLANQVRGQLAGAG